MGRGLLVRRAVGVAALLLFAGGCSLPEASADPEDPHGDLACVDCHQFVEDATRPPSFQITGVLQPHQVAGNTTVPEATCTGSGCHTDAGPRELTFRSVTFTHQDHGADTVVDMSCAGCHTHDSGDEPLVADFSSCALCHMAEQTAGNAGECRLCHTQPTHVAWTSQEVPVPHEDLPWLDGGCVRCHYDVTETTVEVSTLTCGACHAGATGYEEGSEVEDLHPSHTGVRCVSCHEDEGHRINAMSTAIFLDCSQCHAQVHAVEVTAEWPEASTCNDCHTGLHAEQQRVVLGIVDENAEPLPSQKFLSGLSCQSCHVPVQGADPATSVEGTRASCVACHRAEFGEVLDWWLEGTEGRLRRVQGFLDRARSALGETPQLDTAGARLDLLEAGGAYHNLLFAQRVMADAADRIQDAYRASGRSVPAAPPLGREPSMGVCSYCHYQVDDPLVFQDMTGSFHREVREGRLGTYRRGG